MSAANEKRNTELLLALDDAWNLQDWDTFEKRHRRDTVVRWPARSMTHGFDAYRAHCAELFKTFPDNHLENRPYLTSFASGDWTCSIAEFTGTMKGWMTLVNGTRAGPTGRRFELDLRRVARWQDDQIVEEYLFYDLAGMLQQLGIEPRGQPSAKVKAVAGIPGVLRSRPCARSESPSWPAPPPVPSTPPRRTPRGASS